MSSLTTFTHPAIIEHVPNEIWAEIMKFSHSSKTPYKTRATYLRRPGIQSISIGQVCSRWRDIALATPGLWTDIHLFVDTNWQYYPYIDLLYLWLKRSRNEPLSVKLVISDYRSMESEPDIHQCFVRLFSHIARWKTAFLQLYHPLMHLPSWNILQASIGGTITLLESLEVSITPSVSTSAEELLPFKLWVNAPALRKLTVAVDPIDHDESIGDLSYRWVTCNHIPYAQLTHLQLRENMEGSIIWDEVHAIFTNAPNLVLCLLSGVEFNPGPWGLPATGPIVLQYLQHLYLGGWNPRSSRLPGPLDRSLIAPSLLTLTFSGIAWNQEAYTRFITQSSCPLEEIHFVGMAIEGYSMYLTEWLQLSPSLRVVHQEDTLNRTMTDEFAQRMLEWDAATRKFVLGPSLQRLSFSRDPTSGYSRAENLSALTQILKKRLCPPNGTSKAFTTISVGSGAEQNVRDNLEALFEEPWCLQLNLNDGMFQSRELWERYGGE